MYKVGICDDNIAFGSQMEKYLEEYAKREAIPLDIVIFGSGSEYLKYLQAEAPCIPEIQMAIYRIILL